MYNSSQAPRADHLRDGEAKSPGDHAGARIIDLARKGTKTCSSAKMGHALTLGEVHDDLQSAAKALLQ